MSRPHGSAAVAIRSCEGLLAGEDTRPGGSMFALIMTVRFKLSEIDSSSVFTVGLSEIDSKICPTVEND
jgi:hypothetical protein